VLRAGGGGVGDGAATTADAPAGARDAAAALAADLVFVDDDAVAAHVRRLRGARGCVRATLTDHNALDAGGRLLGLADEDVVEIVDHHADAGAHAHVVGAARNVSFSAAAARGVGSACTLVAAALLAGGGDVGAGALDAPLARALLGVVLLDTCGLEPAAGKTTPEDARVAAALGALAGERDARGLYASLSALRFEPAGWRALTPAQALASDYKAFATPPVAFGVASLCAPAAAFLGAAGGALAPAVADACAAHARAAGVAFLLIMTMAPTAGAGVFARELAFFAPPPASPHAAAARDVLARLRASPLLRLRELARGATADGGEATLFAQDNAVASRKQAVPLIQQWLAERAGAGAGEQK
jgi:exopolyphosphatase